ncbi:MAG: hypothetical protein AVDCRST_MAG86-2712 [uncultured Truepera sp.]|uniref:DUF4037 domain-containing protein n=1 Tax=uncultured Truepera sp. TaxID=543023 RepID=A0A6J4VL41_9DEIN|nr:MAG: hypothetical protein AVDCRST_MAG86-2712 [uncultured Truepera sp.]
MPPFIKGLELNRLFYAEAVRPLLERYVNPPHAAAQLGAGSDVLGFDTEMSTDHDWGPSVTLFLREDNFSQADAIREMMAQRLPHRFHGYPTRSAEAPDEPGTLLMADGEADRHRVFVTTARRFVFRQLNFDLNTPVQVADWLTFPSQSLLGLTAGAVYHDGIGEVSALRERFAYYPHDVWLYLLAAGWQRIGQEEPFVGRAGSVGDELGSAVIGSRLVRDVMNLAFLLERRYAPYSKWFGSAFAQLEGASDLSPILWRAQRAADWREREAALAEAYGHLARKHNVLGVTAKLPETIGTFHNRPFRVIGGERIAHTILAAVHDSDIQRLAQGPLIGGIDQFSDSTDLRNKGWREKLFALYR